MEAKHTPEPWTVSEDDYGDEIWFGGDGCGTICVNTWFAGGCKDDPEKWAKLKSDAHLIAAAPDLLDALNAVLRWIDDYCETTGFEVVEAQAYAAIAKATGQDGV